MSVLCPVCIIIFINARKEFTALARLLSTKSYSVNIITILFLFPYNKPPENIYADNQWPCSRINQRNQRKGIFTFENQQQHNLAEKNKARKGN